MSSLNQKILWEAYASHRCVFNQNGKYLQAEAFLYGLSASWKLQLRNLMSAVFWMELSIPYFTQWQTLLHMINHPRQITNQPLNQPTNQPHISLQKDNKRNSRGKTGAEAPCGPMCKMPWAERKKLNFATSSCQVRQEQRAHEQQPRAHQEQQHFFAISLPMTQ